MAYGERRDEDGRPREHPFVDRIDVVLSDERIEKSEIEGEGELGTEAHHVSYDVAHLSVAGLCAGENENDGSRESDGYAAAFHPRDGLSKNEEGEDHREDRHGGGDDAGIDGRCVANAHGEETLVADDSQEGCRGKLEDVAPGDGRRLDEE